MSILKPDKFHTPYLFFKTTQPSVIYALFKKSSSERTVSGWDGITGDARTAASKSSCRNLQTLRFVPDKSYAFTFP